MDSGSVSGTGTQNLSPIISCLTRLIPETVGDPLSVEPSRDSPVTREGSTQDVGPWTDPERNKLFVNHPCLTYGPYRVP